MPFWQIPLMIQLCGRVSIQKKSAEIIKGKNLRIDRVKADGKAILTADRDDFGNDGSILNRGTELDQYANVKGTTVHMISSGSIGTKDKPIHFRQTDENCNKASYIKQKQTEEIGSVLCYEM